MLVARAVSVGLLLTTAGKTMTSVAATTCCDPPGLHASPSLDVRFAIPQQRLQKLLAVPGCEPNRLNDLLLLRPDADGQSDPESQEKSNNRHVVFFHGDIQVSDEGRGGQRGLKTKITKQDNFHKLPNLFG